MMELQSYLRPGRSIERVRPAFGSDVLLALGVVAVVALMVLPLPLFLLDALVAMNIAVGIMLVLMGIYVKTALQFSSFPSVLLLSTLFRLALSVATTRMILLEADAGHIIDTFGSLVAGGNVVVGLVVFLIITLVQFLVIAKGAERVAEVGARFTLDAMPGKQMSIDSDLRSGLIDKVEARAKRHNLELESKLHGSMDGAMKFVKGDAIAGIVIIIVNLLGGLAIGVFQIGMPAGEAMARYSILTIGDGLVAQIPALLSAMAAGLIVTRVTDGDADRDLGDSISKQFLAIPRVMIIAGAICLASALVPGFPGGTFLLLGGMLMISGLLLVPALRLRFDRATQPAFETLLKRKQNPRSAVAETGAQAADRAVPLLLALPSDCAAGGKDQYLRAAFEEMLHELRIASGVNLPAVFFHWRRDGAAEWMLHAYEVPIAFGTLSSGSVGHEAMVDDCSRALRREATLFIGLQETSNLLNQAATEMPDIVKEVLRAVPMQTIASILGKLVEEEVSIRNVRSILEALVQAGQFEKDAANLTEYARMALARQLCYRIAPDNVMRVISLDPHFEESLTRSVKKVGADHQLVLDPSRSQVLVQTLIARFDHHDAQALLVPVPLRRQLRAMIVPERFDIPVLSYPELVRTVDLKVLERVREADIRSAQEPSDARSAPSIPLPLVKGLQKADNKREVA